MFRDEGICANLSRIEPSGPIDWGKEVEEQ